MPRGPRETAGGLGEPCPGSRLAQLCQQSFTGAQPDHRCHASHSLPQRPRAYTACHPFPARLSTGTALPVGVVGRERFLVPPGSAASSVLAVSEGTVLHTGGLGGLEPFPDFTGGKLRFRPVHGLLA